MTAQSGQSNRILTALGRNWFTLGVAAAVWTALRHPSAVGAVLGGAGVVRGIPMLMFLIVGLTLPSERIGAGLRQVRLHGLIQCSIFVIAPLYFGITASRLRPVLGDEFVIGVYALAVLPTTVSTCIVLTQSAGGNTVGTIFNSVVSNIAGVFLSPLLLSWLLGSRGGGLPGGDVGRVLASLALTMLVPLVAGQLLRRGVREAAVRYRRHLGNFSQFLVLCMVMISAARSAESTRAAFGDSAIVPALIYIAVSHIVLLAAAYLLARLLRLDRADRISAVFAAPQKTLAAGVVLLSTYFAGSPEVLGIALLPLLLYHPWQLIIAGFVRGVCASDRF